MPRLHEQADLPAGGDATHRQLLFMLDASGDVARFAGREKRLGAAIGVRRVVIEPHSSGDPEDPTPRPCALLVMHELVDLGERPHLDGGLHPETLDFATRCAVVAACNSVDLAAPVCLGVHRLTQPDAPLLTESIWRLRGGVARSDVVCAVDRIKTMLGCDELRILRLGNNGMRLLIGARRGEDLIDAFAAPAESGSPAGDDAGCAARHPPAGVAGRRHTR